MSLRQESLGREEEPRTRKPFVGTLRVSNPAWQSRASSQKRVLRGEGRPSLRSVDSQAKGRVIEPRKVKGSYRVSGTSVQSIQSGTIIRFGSSIDRTRFSGNPTEHRTKDDAEHSEP